MTDAKRSSDPVLAKLLTMVTEVSGILKSHMHDHDINHQVLESKLETMHSAMNSVCSGFPDNDPVGHRMWHDGEIERIRDRAEFWKKMTFELGKYGLLGFAGWALYALWDAFLHGHIK